MYQVTKEELYSVAGVCGVRLEGNKKELQIELRASLEKRGWFRRGNEEGNEEDKEEKSNNQKGYINFGEMVKLSSTERFEFMKLHLQIQKERGKKNKRN